MRTHRTPPSVALLAIAVSLTACVAVNEVVTGRELICVATSDDLCLRAADAVSGNMQGEDPESFPIVKVTVTGQDCADDDLLNVHCWQVEVVTGADPLGCAARLRGNVYERHDGTLVNEGYEGVVLGPTEVCH
jgi:hypothetical protein